MLWVIIVKEIKSTIEKPRLLLPSQSAIVKLTPLRQTQSTIVKQRPLHTTQSTIVKPWSKIAQIEALNESDLELKELEDFLWPMEDETALFSAKTCLTQIFLLRKEFLVNYVCFSIGVNDRAQFCCASCLLNIVYGWSWLYTLLLLRIWMTIGRFRRFLCRFIGYYIVRHDIDPSSFPYIWLVFQ